ncbi:MAG: hypothetical protein LKG11_00845 [Bacilli bacterium]|jgi:hypothetical protein|nr:hypothetical protein [Bacilli bacterium]
MRFFSETLTIIQPPVWGTTQNGHQSVRLEAVEPNVAGGEENRISIVFYGDKTSFVPKGLTRGDRFVCHGHVVGRPGTKYGAYLTLIGESFALLRAGTAQARETEAKEDAG